MTTSVRLVAFDERFLDASFGWLHDPETMRLTRGRPFTRAAQQAWYDGLPGRTDYLVWGIEAAGQPVGAGGFKSVTAADAELFVYVGEPSARGRGLGSAAVRALLDRAPAPRIWLEVGTDNRPALALYRRLGFAERGTGDGTLLDGTLLMDVTRP